MSDILEIETSDHARLNITLTYSWFFDVDRNDPEECLKLFNIHDFVGYSCK